MRYNERGFRRITSIPARTSLDILREGGVAIRIGGGSSFGGARRVSRKETAGETDWRQEVVQHVFQKPPRSENARPKPLYERNGKIDLGTEVVEDYDGKGGMGIILQFAGIKFTKAPFLRGKRNYGPDSAVFHTRVDYRNKATYLIIATRGDIFESQIVPARMDVNPFFQEELYLPQLTTTHDPNSMTVFQKNDLVVVGYNPRPNRK